MKPKFDYNNFDIEKYLAYLKYKKIKKKKKDKTKRRK